MTKRLQLDRDAGIAIDDEPVTKADARAIRAARIEFARGETVSLDDALKKLGLNRGKRA